ncbi:hypothetical protein B0H17DRAFT_1030346 [Mycena rosella]|uniref:Uncharacterized protein n=1 Tax=Mycena rosella TaxID=1033263 RepID=A0AAD7GZ40_MYCRO|nr:hypothetical protein B0H17DRAFT_1030346 [Mycena rosella]
MFDCPGVLLSLGSQRFFAKSIKALRPKPHHKYTSINLDRICCSVEEISKYTPTDEMIWKSIRTMTLQHLSREFFWKCVHNTFRVGDFWTRINTMEIRGIHQQTLVILPVALERSRVTGRMVGW